MGPETQEDPGPDVQGVQSRGRQRGEVQVAGGKIRQGISLVVQWLRPHFPMQGTQVPSLVRELRSQKPQSN